MLYAINVFFALLVTQHLQRTRSEGLPGSWGRAPSPGPRADPGWGAPGTGLGVQPPGQRSAAA